jgi:7SK snRNA methylphosphate capping enzyme
MPNYVESLRPFVGFEKTLAAQADFPRNVSFQVVNALEASWSADTVLFLSTSKWVHLNWGDSGLKSLFLQIYQSLSPGGLFIFEPQDWKSYKKSKFKLKELSKNFDEIQFKPESFDIYLKTLGFLPISSSLCENDKKNFTRSIFIYSKPVN